MISDWIWPDLPFGLRKRQPSVSHGWDECRFDPRDGGALDSSISSKNVVQWEKIRFQSFTAVICPKKWRWHYGDIIWKGVFILRMEWTYSGTRAPSCSSPNFDWSKGKKMLGVSRCCGASQIVSGGLLKLHFPGLILGTGLVTIPFATSHKEIQQQQQQQQQKSFDVSHHPCDVYCTGGLYPVTVYLKSWRNMFFDRFFVYSMLDGMFLLLPLDHCYEPIQPTRSRLGSWPRGWLKFVDF